MSEEFLEPITTEGEDKIPGGAGTSRDQYIPLAAVALIVLCCCCYAAIAAITVGTTPLLDLLA